MSDTTTCGQCGEQITEEPSGSAQRKSCPKCGSTTRNISVSIHIPISSLATVQTSVTTYPQKLLAIARKLIDEQEYSIAVVVAHMACEIATERSFSKAFITRGIPNLENAMMKFVNGRNLAHEPIQKLYTAFTGDKVQNTAFWQKFKESSTRRNKIMHKGLVVGQGEAEDAYKATSDLIGHLQE